MKKLAVLALFLCLVSTSAGFAASDTENWCGTYFEHEDRGYIRLAMADLPTGSSSCSVDTYNERIEKAGHANIALDFTKNRSTISNWRKFSDHVIEIRGKLKNGFISNARFIRDLGL